MLRKASLSSTLEIIIRQYAIEQGIYKWPEPEPKPKPDLKVAAQSEAKPQSVQVGLARPVGDPLERLDPNLLQGTRFADARVVRVPTEELYYSAVRRAFAPKRGLLVKFEYHPLQRYDDEVPACHREKGR
jgi:hypothetical protein